MNPIGFDSLFNEGDINGGLQRLVGLVTGAKDNIVKQLDGIKDSATEAFTSLSGTSSATKGGQDLIKVKVAELEELAKAYEKNSNVVNALNANIEKLNATMSKPKGGGTPKLELDMQKLNDILAKSGITLGNYQKTLVQANIAEQDRAKIARLVNQIDLSRLKTTSQMTKAYTLFKTLLSSVTQEEINESKALQRLAETTREMKDEVDASNAYLGDYRGQVGSYSKALNGVNLSTQQILREMPTLANSFSQFFMAISNNVPIFVDNLKRAREETGSWGTAMKAILTSIFSWQTALLVVLTILPKVAKAIHDKRKAQEEDNKATEKAIRYAELLAQAHTDITKAVVQEVSALRTYYTISQDYNRSLDDRIKAGEIIKDQYKDAFENFSAEEIALGKAKVAYDELTKSLVLQAKQRAYLNKITSIQEQMIDQMALRDQAKVAKDAADAEVARVQAMLDAYDASVDATNAVGAYGEGYANLADQLGKAQKAQEKANAAFMKADMPLQEMDNTIKKLTDEMPVNGILTQLLTGGGKDKNKEYNVGEYLYQFWQTVVDGMESGMKKELEQLRLNYAKQLNERNKQIAALKEVQEKGNEEEIAEATKQLEYLNGIKRNESLNYERDRLLIVNKYLDAANVEYEKAADETLAIIQEAQKEQLEELESYYRTEENLAFASYKNKKNRTRAQLKLEIEYLKARKQLLLEQGKLTLQMDNEIESSIEAIQQEIKDLLPKNLLDLFSQLADENWTQGFMTNMQRAFDTAFDYMGKWIDYRIKMAEEAVKAAQAEADAAKDALDLEQEARVNGYANNVELARKEYEEKLALEKKALEQKQKYERIQQELSSASQAASMAEAIANMWAAYTKGNVLGAVLAGAATAAALASFTSAKISAYKAAKLTYGEGGYEYMNYGGSHASGHDIDFGRTRDGRQRRVERGEMVGIINKKNVAKYGVGTIGGIIDSLNNGTFEYADKYALAFQGSDLSTLEHGVNALVEQGKTRIVSTPWGRIEYDGNVKRIIKN